jgi:hypothetical protein
MLRRINKMLAAISAPPRPNNPREEKSHVQIVGKTWHLHHLMTKELASNAPLPVHQQEARIHLDYRSA